MSSFRVSEKRRNLGDMNWLDNFYIKRSQLLNMTRGRLIKVAKTFKLKYEN